MQAPEDRWQRLADEVGLANATRLIMAENPGRGDSVRELDDIWEGKDVFQIYEAILKRPSSDPVAAALWGETRAGANALHLSTTLFPDVQPSVTCNR